MPDPKGQEACPEQEDDGEDQIQHLQEKDRKMISAFQKDEKHFRAVVCNCGSRHSTHRNVQEIKSNANSLCFDFWLLIPRDKTEAFCSGVEEMLSFLACSSGWPAPDSLDSN